MVERPELVESFRRLAAKAAEGDREAASELLRALIDRHHDRQAAATHALHASNSRDLWERFVEYLATGRWQGKSLLLLLDSDVRRLKLRHRLHVLLTLHHDRESDAAREAALTGALQHQSREVRCSAADLLGERHMTDAVDALIGGLDDPAPQVRIHAARALGKLEATAAVEPLVRCLAHRNDALAGAAAEALGEIGPSSVPALVTACESTDEWVRWHAARALGHLRDARAIPPLVTMLGDEDAAVRWAAVHALHHQGAPAIEPVVRSLTTRTVTPLVADAAGHVVRQVQEPRLAAVLRPLGEHLRDRYAAVSVPTIAGQVLNAIHAQPSLTRAPPPA